MEQENNLLIAIEKYISLEESEKELFLQVIKPELFENKKAIIEKELEPYSEEWYYQKLKSKYNNKFVKKEKSNYKKSSA